LGEFTITFSIQNRPDWLGRRNVVTSGTAPEVVSIHAIEFQFIGTPERKSSTHLFTGSLTLSSLSLEAAYRFGNCLVNTEGVLQVQSRMELWPPGIEVVIGVN